MRSLSSSTQMLHGCFEIPSASTPCFARPSRPSRRKGRERRANNSSSLTVPRYRDVPALALGGYFDPRGHAPLLERAFELGVTYWETTLRWSGEGNAARLLRRMRRDLRGQRRGGRSGHRRHAIPDVRAKLSGSRARTRGLLPTSHAMRQAIARQDDSLAEIRCPQRMPIGAWMRSAGDELAQSAAALHVGATSAPGSALPAPPTRCACRRERGRRR